MGGLCVFFLACGLCPWNWTTELGSARLRKTLFQIMTTLRRIPLKLLFYFECLVRPYV